uniref:Uncharacterized protein n=1 Tax=Arundo donax TaxID=35708 RepID=A0A0A9AZX6_ARUDO
MSQSQSHLLQQQREDRFGPHLHMLIIHYCCSLSAIP